jgi:hypothetical protein
MDALLARCSTDGSSSIVVLGTVNRHRSSVQQGEASKGELWVRLDYLVR